ncbi:MAG: CvpA family protein [Flavobacteriaceae bacterium]|nr:CvpA family protein [Flavobacteriaceae bacterium]
MNLVDIVLGIILLLAFYSGFKKGLFVALASLIGLIAGVFGAIYFSDFAGAYISKWFDLGDEATKWISFAVTFMGIIFIIGYLGRFLTKIADFAALGLLNKLLGGVFSTLQYAFIISVVFMFFDTSNITGFVISEEKKSESKLYGPVASLAPMVIPKVVKIFKKETGDSEEPSEETT